MKLDIIIPHYRENIATVLVALNSIEKQVDYDFSQTTVTIMNDYGAKALKLDAFDFPFNLQQMYMPEKRTLGELRQYAIEHTSNDYILWCDSDDCFINNMMLSLFDEKIESHPETELIYTPYFTEMKNPDGTYYYFKEETYVMTGVLHGKLFSRKFINEYDLKFQPLAVSEDTTYVFSCFNFARHCFFIEEAASYLYRFNENSVTRKDNPFNVIPEANVHGFNTSLQSYEAFCDLVIKYKDDPKGICTTRIIGYMIQSTFYFSLLHEDIAKQVGAAEVGKTTKIEMDRIIKKFIPYYNDDDIKEQREKILQNMPLFKPYSDVKFEDYYKSLLCVA